MYQQEIKSPAWEVESVNGNSTITFSSRNSGCADFVAISIHKVAKKALEAGILIKRDEMGYYVGTMGDKGIRDPEAPCERFDPSPYQIGDGPRDCYTDGHYLCRECKFRRDETNL